VRAWEKGGNQLEPQVVQEAAERSRNIGDQSEGVDRLDAVAARIQSSPPQGVHVLHKRLCPKEPARSPRRLAELVGRLRAGLHLRDEPVRRFDTYVLEDVQIAASDSNRSPTRGACPFSRNSDQAA